MANDKKAEDNKTAKTKAGGHTGTEVAQSGATGRGPACEAAAGPASARPGRGVDARKAGEEETKRSRDAEEKNAEKTSTKA